MGTPHEGSDIAGKGNVMLVVLKNVVSIGGFGAHVQSKLLKDLSANSKELWEISRSFTRRAGDINQFISCIEQSVVSGMTERVSSVPHSHSIL